MGGGKKKKIMAVALEPYHPAKANGHVSSRNLLAKNLCGVIFGCTHETIAECLSEQLFGLPIGHMYYVQNIRPGLPLFLFNYSDRTLHGIFEAVTNGKKYLDPFAWTDGSKRTAYPAQVRVCTKVHCHPLAENQFKRIIEKNYISETHHFWFELDKAQTRELIALFKPSNSSANKWSADLSANQSVATLSMPTKSGKNELLTSSSPTKSLSKELVSSSSTNTWKDILCGKKPINDCTENVSLIRTSYNELDVIESKSVSDWEDHVDEQNIISSVSTSTATGSTCATETNSVANDETSTINESLDSEENISNSYSNGCTHDDIINCGLVDGKNDGSGLGTDGPSLSFPSSYGTTTVVECENTYNCNYVNNEDVRILTEFKGCIAELKSHQVRSDHEIQQLKRQLWYSDRKIGYLEDRVKELEFRTDRSKRVDESLDNFVKQCLGSEDVIYLVGGFNGLSWLSALDSFSPSLDIITSLKPMSYVRSYTASVSLDGNIFVSGGRSENSWFDTVEYYNRRDDEWIMCPSMLRKKGSLSGVTYNGKIFAIGGGDAKECLSDVEIFDPKYGKWSAVRSMLHKRLASAAAELNGVIYAVGGFNGHQYLRSAERIDPREGSWISISNMNIRRGSHSMAVLNGKLYCAGGYDGERMVSSMESYEPRTDSWVVSEPMKFGRGYPAAVVLGGALYVIGGINHDEQIVETVECYKEGAGWSNSGWKNIGKRSFFSAVVL